MANIKNTNITQGTIKTLTFTFGDLIVSSSNVAIDIQDTENTDSTSYLPYSNGYTEVSLFGNSADIEIGKKDSSSVKRTELIVQGIQPTINIANDSRINSSFSINGWIRTDTTQIGLQTYYDYIYDKKIDFRCETTSLYESTLSIHTPDNTDPDNISEAINISKNLVSIKKDIVPHLYHNMFSGSLELLPNSTGNRNLIVRNKLVVTDDEDYDYTSGGYRRYLLETGLVLGPTREGLYDIGFDTVQYQAMPIGFEYSYYRHTFDTSTYDKGRIELYKPATSSTSNYWVLYGFRFSRQPQGNYTSLGDPPFGSNNIQMNFTGQHRCSSEQDHNFYEDKIGMIVVSTGKYKDLQNNEVLQINQSIPIITLSSQRNQKNVFGVVSDKEEENSSERILGLNAWVSQLKREKGSEYTKIIVNSIGEGAIWICNINGNLENGDFITSCEIPGYGMKQDVNKMANYTVAKITCDCNFDLDSPIYICEEFQWQGQTYRKAFVGCTYHCG